MVILVKKCPSNLGWLILEPGEKLPSKAQIRPVGDKQLDTLLRALPQRPLAADPEEGVRLSLAGAQPKLPIIITSDGTMALPLNAAAATTHIIKPEPARFPGLVDNEAFCMELARAVGLPVATANKRTSTTGVPYLLVERYDRDLSTKPIRRLHQEDFCQALGCPSDRKYQAEGGPTVIDVVLLLRACSAVPARDIPTLWRSLVFNWLVGNCDAHGKNFSLLYDSNGPAFAPLYDLVSTTVYPELTQRLAMSLDGARQIDEVTTTVWDNLAKEADYGVRFARSESNSTIESVVAEASRLAAERRHDNDVSKAILKGILARAS